MMGIENFNRNYGKFTWENMVKILEALNVPQPEREFIVPMGLEEAKKWQKKIKSYKSPLNQCEECGKFKKWEELEISEFIPDNEFSCEQTSYICLTCKKIK